MIIADAFILFNYLIAILLIHLCRYQRCMYDGLHDSLEKLQKDSDTSCVTRVSRMYHRGLCSQPEKTLSRGIAFRPGSPPSPFIPLPGGAWDFLRSRNLITDEVELRAGARARWRARARSSRERGSALLLECWWPAEVALIHRNFTGCQAGLTGLCHGSNAEESHPTEISVSSPGSVRAATESRMNLDVAHTYLSTCVVEIDLCDLCEFHLGVVTPPTPPIDSGPIGGF